MTFDDWINGEWRGLVFVGCLSLLTMGTAGCYPDRYDPFAEPNHDYEILLDKGPCWNDICPRQTHFPEAVAILRNLDFVELERLEYAKHRNEFTVPFEQESYESAHMVFRYYDDIVSSITLSDFEGNLASEQIINVYGDPTWVVQTIHDQGGDIHGLWSKFELWYPEDGVSISVAGPGWSANEIPANLGLLQPLFEVLEVRYHRRDLTEEQWLESFPPCSKRAEELLEYLFAWPGLEQSVSAAADCSF